MPRKVYSVNIGPRSTRRRAPEPRHTYHHGHLRQALVQTALEQLERSSEELSLRQLARSVGVTVNAAYRHFTDKDALLAAVAAEGFRQFSAQQHAAAVGIAGADDALLALGHAYVQFAREHPALFRLMFARREPARPASAELTQAGQEAFRGLTGAVATRLRLPPDDPRTLTAAIQAWALVHGLSHLLLEGQLEHFSRSADELIAAVLAGTPALRAPRGAARARSSGR